MRKKATDNFLFDANDDGTFQFLPLFTDHGAIICKNFNEEINTLVKQKISDEKRLSKLSDEESKKTTLINLIILQVR